MYLDQIHLAVANFLVIKLLEEINIFNEDKKEKIYKSKAILESYQNQYNRKIELLQEELQMIKKQNFIAKYSQNNVIILILIGIFLI